MRPHMDLFKLVYLGSPPGNGPTHMGTYSQSQAPDLFKHVHCAAHTSICYRAIGHQLKNLLIWIYSTTR